MAATDQGLAGGTALTFPTLDALLAVPSANVPGNNLAFVAGYTRPGDGGGGTFLWVDDRAEPADGVLVFGSAASGGRWVRQWTGGQITPEMAGASSDGRADDVAAFARLIALSRRIGPFTITLGVGKAYYLGSTLDMSTGAPGLVVQGPAQAAVPEHDHWTESRIVLNPAAGAYVKLGASQVLRDIVIWRHDLRPPESLAEVREQVAAWFAEDGRDRPLSLGVFAPFDDAVIDGALVVGFHTGIRATGGRFKIRHCRVDAAGHAVEVAGSKDTSIIEDVQTRAYWSASVPGQDAFGDQSYRPGAAFYVHDSADGLQINSVMSIGWVNGLWFDGSRRANDWLISVLQPNVETPANNGQRVAAIRTTGDVRRLTIIDPRIVAGGTGPCAGLDFGHTDPNPGAAANNNVTVIGGTVEIAAPHGNAVLLRAGSTGMITDTTLNLTSSDVRGPMIRVEPHVGRWSLVHLIGVNDPAQISIDPSSVDEISMDAVLHRP